METKNPLAPVACMDRRSKGIGMSVNVLLALYMAKALKPPSTTATVPVTNLAASLIR